MQSSFLPCTLSKPKYLAWDEMDTNEETSIQSRTDDLRKSPDHINSSLDSNEELVPSTVSGIATGKFNIIFGGSYKTRTNLERQVADMRRPVDIKPSNQQNDLIDENALPITEHGTY